MNRMSTAAALAVAITCLVAVTTTHLAAATSTLIMSGLNNPRGLAIGPDGGIYVAEAGAGGAGPCTINATNENRCFGNTGAVSRWLNGVQQRVFSQFPSHALVGGGAALGPSDVAFQGSQMFVLMGLGFDPTQRSVLFGGDLFGKLLQVSPTGQITEAGDVSAFERDVNPAGGPVDSNPFGLLVLPTVRLVTDAGGNALLSVVPSGLVNKVAVFPSRPTRTTDAVATSVAVGPDGAYYVSELTGVPFAAGAANIWRVVPGQAPTVFRSGFTTVTDIDFGPDGSLYVVEHSTGPAFFGLPGDLVKITPDGQRTVLVSNLDRPTSLRVASDGSVYYTNRGITAGAGEVWKWTP
jgi:hypothetical protein